MINNERPVRKYSSAGGVVVREADGHVLVLLRAGRLGPEGPPEVRLPKGHIEPGESAEQAAVREVREEAGLPVPVIVAALGHQPVEFDWQGVHYIRDENYYLMSAAASGELVAPERQFERQWLPWDDALSQITFDAEREWLRRARYAWNCHLEDVSDQDSD